ncbi:hypothetical protein [Psychroserpens sp.]|uniref:hypothetical protein n=1 Tax=Psychroserpens sp. TaxID=2020870 RepID=UPI001B28C5C1|nr:hypothetical protein [Psychroserpens sp.]MBO6606955.1 hypothetical protein [Psychroserpens sp.]MBO6630824.1 hypothetical protein [Psychroserpens sp.]MBO6654101.1 hypothetical protein [Psychroserpens sp.]MBO6682613.1 hypothetical protein [Psychroserpens sp.]MBO6750727.1 hypothetical protein [Psychroserpens sp.]
MEREEYYKNIDRVYRLPRVWSNRELSKFAHLFKGSVANVSGWKDIDKEGKHYKDYFTNASEYVITNYLSEVKGIQDADKEIFLDLTKPVPKELINRFDVVFNHTVLEHVYEVHQAFENICLMTKDIAIIVVPFLQEMHADYGDFWRFTPLTMDRLFNENAMEMMYCSFNSHENASVYLFCIATKNKNKWQDIIPQSKSHIDPFKKGQHRNFVGCHAIRNPNTEGIIRKILRKLKGALVRG